MRRALLSLAAVAATAAFASPALANEARVEARGGVVFGGGVDDEAIAGIAAGYDYDLGKNGFIGLEVSGDKILTSGTKVSFGASVRAGAKVADATKIYAIGGYNTEFVDDFAGQWSAGAGLQQDIGSRLYAKVEYRHAFIDDFNDSDVVVGGLGVRF